MSKRRIVKMNIDRCPVDKQTISDRKCSVCQWGGMTWLMDKKDKPYSVKIHCKIPDFMIKVEQEAQLKKETK